MNPTGAPEPPSDSGRIVRGIFVLMAGARERTRGCSPRAPGRFGQNWLGGLLCLSAGEVFLRLCRRVRVSAPMGVAPEPPCGLGGTGWGFFMLCLWVCVL